MAPINIVMGLNWKLADIFWHVLKNKKQNEYNLLSSNNNCPSFSIFQLTKCFYTLASILSQILSVYWENFIVSFRFLLTSHVVTVTGWLCQLMPIYDTPISQRPKLLWKIWAWSYTWELNSNSDTNNLVNYSSVSLNSNDSFHFCGVLWVQTLA